MFVAFGSSLKLMTEVCEMHNVDFTDLHDSYQCDADVPAY